MSEQAASVTALVRLRLTVNRADGRVEHIEVVDGARVPADAAAEEEGSP